MKLRLLLLLTALLAIVRADADGNDEYAYDPDAEPEPDYGGDGEYGGEDDYGGEEPPAPPPGGQVELATVEDFESFLDDNDASVIAAFTATEIADPEASIPDGWDAEEDGEWDTPKIENPALTSFKDISASLSDYRWAYTSTPEVLEKLKSKGGGLYLYRSQRFVSKDHGDRPRERFPSATLTESTVQTWLEDKAQPLVGQFTSASKQRYLGKMSAPKIPVLVVFLNLDFEANAKSVAYVLKRARKVALTLKGKLSIAVASVSEYKILLEEDFGLETKSEKSDILMGLQQRKAGKDFYYGTKAAFSEKSLSAFAADFLEGKLEAHRVDDGSSPPPPPEEDLEDDVEGTEYDESDVLTLDSSNMDSVLTDPKTDKLVEFYAPWCGHCKALAPEYAKVAKELAEFAPNVVVAKMDATAHDPPAGFEVQGYPTIYFIKAGEGAKPVPYDGEREADAMIAYVKENAVTKMANI